MYKNYTIKIGMSPGYLCKLVVIMKLTTFIILISLMQVSASTFGQKMTLVERSVSLEKVLMEIRKQTGYDVLIIDTKFDLKKRIKADFNAAPLDQVMDRIVRGTDFTYKIDEKNVVLKQKERSFLDRIIDRFAAIDVRGRVVDENGNPLPGASVKVKGINKVTKTDADGEFYLQGVDEATVLQISYVGYKTQEINTLSNLGIIRMELGDSELDEITINKGYYSESKMLSTGSVVKITAKDIERQPVTNPLMALQGRVPGFDITPNTGVAGGAVKVEIRGRNSISNTNAYPLYVIDGIPVDATPIQSNNTLVLGPYGYDPLSTINPANIESIEILKDADATAIYGSRGANGVILITTKKGEQSQKTNVDVGAYTGAGKTQRFIELLNTQQYVAMRKEAYFNAGQAIAGSSARDLLQWDTTRYTDWQKELLGGTAITNDVQANVSSGTRQTSFRFGVGYHKEGMTVPGDFGYKRMAGNFNLNHLSIDQKFQATLSSNYGVESNKLFRGDLADYALTLPPNAPALHDVTGKLNWENSTWTNPLAELEKTERTRTDNIVVNGSLSYKLIPDLTARVSLGYNALNGNAVSRDIPLSSMDPALIDNSTTATGSFAITRRNSWIVEPQLSYEKIVNNHSLNVLLGGTLQESKSANQLVEAYGYSSDVLLGSLQGATSTSYLSDVNSEYRYMAAYGRIGYNFNQKYVLNLTGRRDGSSRFGPDKRWGNFGAAGAAWIFSKENFMAGIPFISFGKLRGSYGITGSDQVGNYKYLSTYTFMPYQYQGSLSLSPTGLANLDYAWESTKKMEIAMEIGLLKDRINIEAAWYRNRCSNQLLNFPLPGATGFSSVTDNLDATVENRGWELMIRTDNINQNNFKWTSSFNISIPKNELISYPNIDESPYASTYVVGKSLNISKRTRYKGVNPTTGVYEIEDADGNGIFNSSEDLVSITEIGRRYYGGLNNSFQYKGIELAFLFQYSKQVSLGYGFPLAGLRRINVPVEVFENHWKKEGDIAKYQKFSSRLSDVFFTQSDAYVSDGRLEENSFIRLKTLSLTYSLPVQLLKKLPVKACNIYVQGQNLFTVTNFNLLDPETGSYLPPLKMITCGVQIKL